MYNFNFYIMRKIKFLVLLVAVSFISCKDATEIVQDGEINDVVTFSSTQQMKLFLSETYDKLVTSNTLNEISVSSILTDEVGIGNSGGVTALYRFNLQTNSGYASQIWLDNYSVINYCNRLIRGSSLVTPVDSADLLVYNDVIAQARALRAYCHLQLLTYFSPDMKNNNALGVILMDRVPTISEKLQRNTNGEVFGLIEADLNFAFTNLQTPTGSKVWAFVSRDMVNACRARMYAYRGNYTQAETFADAVINTSGLVLTNGTVFTITNQAPFYATSSNNEYKRMFQDGIRGEIIWSIARTPTKQAIGNVYNVNASNLLGLPSFDMNRNLFNILDNNGAPWDIRRYANIDPTSLVNVNYLTSTAYNSDDVLVVDKYNGIAGAQSINDLKAFRLSEMYLIKAEARAFANDLSGVATLLKTIRDRRSFSGARPLPTYANVTEAWADILKERRVELCFEGHRLIDLKRLGALANVTIDRHPLDCSTYSLPTCSLPVTDYRFTLPIPLNEVTGNPTIQQNPGY